ncbi:MAG: AAC(3) family N-acetyltransferase [Anaerolineae bacterium]|nr:AAC(3) family N-acetyltransferase [Anaerolineae bacterium]
MDVTREDIAAGVRAIGVPPGATVLVHSSLSSFGHVVGGPHSVIQGLLQAVGPEGTVVFPTLTGSAELGPDNPPYFDVRQTPCWTGRIPEVARQHPEARRSLHPTHSVAAIGPGTAELLEGHELSPTPCGPDTPFGRLVRSDSGYVVFLGVGLQCNTTFHHAEEVAGVTYHMQQEPVTAIIVDYEGRERSVRLWLHRYGPRRNFPRPEPYFLAKGIQKMGRIANCTVRVLKARPMVEYVLDRLRQDPEYLLAPQ